MFRTGDGRLFTEDGQEVTDQRGSISGLSETTSGWEEFLRARASLEELDRRRREVEEYQRGVLDPLRRRLADPERPMTPEELREYIERVHRGPPDVRDALKEAAAAGPHAGIPPDGSVADDLLGPYSPENAPDLQAQFRAAHDALPLELGFEFDPSAPKVA